MAEITAQMVKDLREKTGAGMGDCKKALVESEGDINGAIEYLRKKGAASVAKRADRSANEGLVVTRTKEDGKKAIVVEINSETDFVAKNADFLNFANTVADALIANDVVDMDSLLALTLNGDTVQAHFNDILAKFGEKIEIRRFKSINSNGFIADYTHAGSKLAVLVEVSASELNELSKKLLREIAMQVAAMNPMYIDRSFATQEQINKEIEIYTEQAVAEGKKPEIAQKVATGRLEKYFQEQCLVEQTFVKDPSKTVNDVLKEISAEVGNEVTIKNFIRYFLGENN